MEQYDGSTPPAIDLGVLSWRRSSASDPYGDAIEVAQLPGGEVAVRSSLAPAGPALVYTRAEIDAFILGVKDGEFDDLLEPTPTATPGTDG